MPRDTAINFRQAAQSLGCRFNSLTWCDFCRQKSCILWYRGLQTLNIVLTASFRQSQFPCRGMFLRSKTHPSGNRTNQCRDRKQKPKIYGFDWPRNSPAAPPPQRLTYKHRLARTRQEVVCDGIMNTTSGRMALWKTGTDDAFRRRALAGCRNKLKPAVWRSPDLFPASPGRAQSPVRRPCRARPRRESRPSGQARRPARWPLRRETIGGSARPFPASVFFLL
jgi:hypothetical protein